jgi:hypothetical protein
MVALRCKVENILSKTAIFGRFAPAFASATDSTAYIFRRTCALDWDKIQGRLGGNLSRRHAKSGFASDSPKERRARGFGAQEAALTIL